MTPLAEIQKLRHLLKDLVGRVRYVTATLDVREYPPWDYLKQAMAQADKYLAATEPEAVFPIDIPEASE